MPEPSATTGQAAIQGSAGIGARRSQRQLARQIHAAFEGRIRRPRVSVFYRLAVLVVAGAMVLLPLIYIGLICLSAYAVYYHATHHYSVIFASDNPFARVYLASFFVVPILAGVILVVFMFKPLSAKSALEFRSIEVDRAEEPLLFTFVQSVCKAVHAPMPRRIMVDCQPNASACFDHGLGGFLRGRLVLTLGLPLVVSQNTRELAGVLAHEFGHFSQGSAMRLFGLVGAVNDWFGRVVSERDTWDKRLLVLSQSESATVGLAVWLASLMIWLVRCILWILMMVGHAISCLLSRRMEYNADQYQIRLAGSDAFAATARRFNLLNAAFLGTMQDLGQAWGEGRLSDDVASLIVANARKIPKKKREQIETEGLQLRTRLFDTHPSDRARIRRAQKAHSPGVFRLEILSLNLFQDYPSLARLASVMYYAAVVGKSVNPDMLTPIKELEESQRRAGEARKVQARYCQNIWTPLFLPEIEETRILPPADYNATARNLVSARDLMEAALDSIRTTYGLYQEEYEALIKAKTALVLGNVGFPFRPEEFGLTDSNRQAIQRVVHERTRFVEQFRGQMKCFNEWAQTRLLSALRLVHHPKIRERIGEDSVEIAEVERLCAALAALGRAHGLIESLQQHFGVLSVLLKKCERKRWNKKLRVALSREMASCRTPIERVFRTLNFYPYPFEHGKAGATLGRYVTGGLPQTECIAVVYKAKQTLDNYFALYFRLVGHLAQIAELVESAIGLEPWPDPPEEEEKEEDEWAVLSAMAWLIPDNLRPYSN